MTDASPGRTGSGLSPLARTLRIGGILLLVSVLPPLFPYVTGYAPEAVRVVLGWIGNLAFSAALLVFAFGFGRGAGSLVARRAVPVVAAVVLAAWPLLEQVLATVLPYTPDLATFYSAWGWATLTVKLAATLIFVVAIARAGVITGAVRWAPLWALVAVALPQIASLVLVAAIPASLGLDQEGLLLVYGVGQLTMTAAPLVLGVLAVVRSTRVDHAPPPPPVQVYPPAS